METLMLMVVLLLNQAMHKFKTHPHQSIQTSIQCITDSDMETLSLKDPPLLNRSKTHQLQLIQTLTQCTTGSDMETHSSKAPPSLNKSRTHPHQSIQTSIQCTTGSDTETPSLKDPPSLKKLQTTQNSLLVKPLVLLIANNQDSDLHTIENNETLRHFCLRLLHVYFSK